MHHLENKNLERNKILFNGAIEQFLYENKENFPNSDNVAIEDKIRRFNNFISRTNNKSCSDKKKKSDKKKINLIFNNECNPKDIVIFNDEDRIK